MADKRQKTAAILLQIPGKKANLELFDATQWPERPETSGGLVRIRKNGRWFQQPDKYTFLSREAVLNYLGDLLAPAFGWKCRRKSKRPVLTPGARVNLLRMDGTTERLMVMTKPLQGFDGRWYVFVAAGAYRQVRPDPVPVEDLEVIKG